MINSFSSLFQPAPAHLDTDLRQAWLRRMRTAENTLEIQAISGTVPDAETIVHFQRYVRGELTLSQAIERVRKQLAQEHDGFRLYLNRQNII